MRAAGRSSHRTIKDDLVSNLDPRLFATLRTEYSRVGIDEKDFDPDPFVQFRFWFNIASSSGVSEANAMTLATASAEGVPSARTVLLKGFDEHGFVFYTNYESQKGEELRENPRAALLFFWKELHRQVRVTGSVERVTREESEAYFHSRPVGSQLGSAASAQSRPVLDRATLEARYAALESRYAGKDVPLPDFWGGYRVVPASFEFWQGRENRLHDRLRYLPRREGGWAIDRLAP
jgi:pyridoxamine 5'-phosphate oxidase